MGTLDGKLLSFSPYDLSTTRMTLYIVFTSVDASKIAVTIRFPNGVGKSGQRKILLRSSCG
jgi:hypothetical protein